MARSYQEVCACSQVAAERQGDSQGIDALHLLRQPGPCDGQALAVARLMAAGVLRSDVWPSPNVSDWRNDLNRLLTFMDRSLLTTSWNRMVFSGWPLLAVLHRLQEAHFRDAVCDAAGGYALLSRAVPSSVWLCVRWRSHGEFVDCTYIASSLGHGNGLFLDVGANLGACTLLIANQGFNVLALEPNPSTAKLLKAAVLRNSLEQRVRVLQVAAGQQKSQSQLNCWGHSATCQVFEGGSDVESVSLDSLETETAPLAIKIDVEGSEEEVLRGATELLKRKPTLFLELHSFELRERNSSSGQVVDRLLGDLGYDAVRPLFDDFECQRPWVAENGTYRAAAWTSSTWNRRETQNACACAEACWQQLIQGCRCWDFDADELCRLYRSCPDAPQPAKDDSWAGEMNGNWVAHGRAVLPAENGHLEGGPCSENGPSLSGGRLLQGLWNAGTRCIFFDLTYMHVWSKFLAFLWLGRRATSQEDLKKTLGECLLNHRVGFCDQEGTNLFHDTNRVEVVLSPVESEKLQLESPSVWTLCVVLVVAFANSRYVNKMKALWVSAVRAVGAAQLQAFIVWPLALLGLLLCTLHAARTVVDLANCGATSRHHTVDWTQMEAHWANAQVALGKSRLTPSSGAQRVAEYCWVPPLRKQGPGKMTTEAAAEDDFQRQSQDINMTLLVREISLMDSATFLLDFDNQTAVRVYCGKVLQMHAVSQCLRWMNNTELGNRITCQDAVQPQITAVELEGLMEAGSPLACHEAHTQKIPLFGCKEWQFSQCGAQADQTDLKPKPYAVIPPFLQPKKPMAVLRILSLCMLLCCSEAMFKKDMRTVAACHKTVMEEEFPDMKHLGDVVSQATDKAKAIVHQGQQAVEGIKDLALDTFEAAAAKVNQSLKVVGQEVRDMNTTAMKEIISLDDKVKSAKNKAATFAAGTSAVLEKIQPIFEQFLEQLRSVTKMATDALTSISQEVVELTLELEGLSITVRGAPSAASNFVQGLQPISAQHSAASSTGYQSPVGTRTRGRTPSAPASPPAAAFETRDSILASFPAVPASWVSLARQELGTSRRSPEDRARRALGCRSVGTSSGARESQLPKS
eukprot:s726_g7.t1